MSVRARIRGLCTASIVAVFAGGVPGPVRASEGLATAAAYACDPLKVTEAAAAICARHDGAAAPTYAAALAGWKARNAAAIPRLRAECVAEVRRQSDGDAEFGQTLARIDGINRATIAAMAAEVAAGAPRCAEFLRRIESGRDDLDGLFPANR